MGGRDKPGHDELKIELSGSAGELSPRKNKKPLPGFGSGSFGRNSRIGKNVRRHRHGGKNKIGTIIAKFAPK
jgi:hypothetical protein